MKILYISNKPVYPIVDGGCFAMAQLLKSLIHCQHEVKYLCISTPKHPFDPNAFPTSLKDQVSPESVTIDTTLNAFDAFLHIFKTSSYNVDRFNDSEFHDLIKSTLTSSHYDLVIMDSLYTSPYLQSIRAHYDGKIISRSHNVEHLIWKRLASNTRNPLKKWYLRNLSQRLKTVEKAFHNTVDRTWCISESDLQIFRALCPKASFELLPLVVSEIKTDVDYSIQSIFHLGAMNWIPNIQAVQRLVNEIFPKIHGDHPQIKLHLAGSNMDKAFRGSIPSIINHGFVDSPQKFMSNHGILMVPLLSGSGVRVKILEAMSAGVPIIASERAFEGIHIQSGKHAIIANSNKEFIEAAKYLLNSEEKRKELGRNAKAYIEKYHSFNQKIKTLEQLLNSK